MNRVGSIVRKFWRDDEGAALIEYGLLALLVAVLCIVAMRSVGSKVSNGFNSVNIYVP